METDFIGAQNEYIELRRYYNSQAVNTTSFGLNWSSTYDRRIIDPLAGTVFSTNYVQAYRADGRVDTFRLSSGSWVADANVTSALVAIMNGSKQVGWKVVTSDDSTENYNMKGQLTSIITRAGLTTTLTYNSSNQLTTAMGPFGHSLNYSYSLSGVVAAITIPDGGVYNYTYDSYNNLTSVTYPDKSVRQYGYTNPNFPNALTSITDENGSVYAMFDYTPSTAGNMPMAIYSKHAGGVDLTTVSYDKNSSTVTDANGNTSTYALTTLFGLVKPVALTGAPVPAVGGNSFTYDSNGFLASRTDYDNNVTTYTHDGHGNETSRTPAFGTALAQTITTDWHTTFHLPTKISEPGRTTRFTYDGNGNLLNKTIASATLTSTQSWTYNAAGQASTATDPLGHMTTYSYYTTADFPAGGFGNGALKSITNALGHVTSFTNYDGAGRLLRAVDPNGTVTTLTYDARGRLTSRTVGGLKTRYYYDLAGNLQSIIKPDSSWLYFVYDAAHRPTQVYDSLLNRIVYTYDSASNRTKEEVFDAANVLKQTRSYVYDNVNRLSQAVGALGQTSNYTYDPQGNLTQITDPLGNASGLVYDSLNRPSQTTDAKGAAIVLGYDSADRLASVTDARGVQTTYANNALDLPTAIVSPDAGAATKTYDAAGNVLSATDGNGKTTLYQYDALNRVVRAAHSDGTVTTYQYDQGTNGIGHLTTLTDPSGATTSWSYNSFGQISLKSLTLKGVTLTTRWAYGATNGRLTSLTYPSGRVVSFVYDAAGRVSGIYYQPSASGPVSTLLNQITYQPFGGPAGWVFGNGASYARTFDLDGRIASLSLPANDNIALTYDAASRIKGIAETGLPSKAFTYDKIGQLVSYTSGALTQGYMYDLVGNRLSFSQTGVSPEAVNYMYDPASNHLLALTGSSNDSFSYDAAGNTTYHASALMALRFGYDGRNRQNWAAYGSLGRDFSVNALGQRVAVKSRSQLPNGGGGLPTLFVYGEAGHLLGSYDGTGVALDETVWLGNLPVTTMQSSGLYAISPDHLGAPHQIINAAQQVVWFWDHDPFGNGTPTGSLTYNLRFPGQFYDGTTGLYYNYFRDYDPKTGRYIESDPIGLAGGINTYAYVGGNPLSHFDLSGLQDQTFLPPEFYQRNAPTLISPGKSWYDWFKWNDRTGKWEYSRVFYNRFGQQVGRTDFTDHGYCSVHDEPHFHTTEWGAGYDPQYGYETGPYSGEYPEGPSPSSVQPETTPPSELSPSRSWGDWGFGRGSRGGGGGGAVVFNPKDNSFSRRLLDE